MLAAPDVCAQNRTWEGCVRVMRAGQKNRRLVWKPHMQRQEKKNRPPSPRIGWALARAGGAGLARVWNSYSIPRVGISPGLYDLEKKIGCRAFSRKTQTDLSVRKAHTTHLKSYYKVRKRTQQICINRTLLENSSRNLMKLSNKNFLYTVT